MAEEIFKNTALRSLDDFERLTVPNGSSDLSERLETGDPAVLEAIVARVQRGKPLLFLFHGDGISPRIERLSLFAPERSEPLLIGLVESRWRHAVQQSSPSPIMPSSPALRCDTQFAGDAYPRCSFSVTPTCVKTSDTPPGRKLPPLF